MANQLTIEYDEIGDILYLDIAPPTDQQTMLETAPGSLLRQNTATGAIEGIEIHGLRGRHGNREVAVPVGIDLRLLGAAGC